MRSFSNAVLPICLITLCCVCGCAPKTPPAAQTPAATDTPQPLPSRGELAPAAPNMKDYQRNRHSIQPTRKP